MRRAYAEIPEGQMHYRWAGSGEDHVILMHMSGSSSDEFERTGDLLAEKGLHVCAVDLLAFGGSDPPPRYYTLADHGETVTAFMDALGMDRAYLYGNLAAANLAVHIGADHPERVRGMMLAHPLHSPDPVQYAQKRFLPEYAVVEPSADGSHLRELWSRSAKYGEPPEICDARCRCLYRAGAWGETLHWALFEDTPVVQLFPRVQVPTVVVAYDAFGDPEKLKEVSKLLPNGRFDCYPGGTPYISRSHPERVADMFLKYFSPAPD